MDLPVWLTGRHPIAPPGCACSPLRPERGAPAGSRSCPHGSAIAGLTGEGCQKLTYAIQDYLDAMRARMREDEERAMQEAEEQLARARAEALDDPEPQP